MASNPSLFPRRQPVEADTSPEVHSLADAGDQITALQTKTARALLDEVHQEPAPASELAARTDTSLQNALYHLEQLSEVGLVEVIDTWYSEKGRDMKVYGPADAPLLIVAGAPDSDEELCDIVSRSPDEVDDGTGYRVEGAD